MKTTPAAIMALFPMSPAGLAGACPADQVLTTPRAIENAPDAGVERPILHEAGDSTPRSASAPRIGGKTRRISRWS